MGVWVGEWLVESIGMVSAQMLTWHLPFIL